MQIKLLYNYTLLLKMKKTTSMKALMLSLAMTAMLLPMTSFAQQTSDDFFRVDDAFNGNRDVLAITLIGNLANDDFGAPLGSGLLILTAAGAGYAISRRKRSFRKGSALVLAALMLLGMTACKKKIAEPITPATGNQVAITLNVGGGAKAEVDPPHVNFVENDKILVAHDGKYVGTLTYTEYETGKFHFQGNIDATVATPRQKLYFYFLGNKQNDALLEAGTTTSCTVNISDQSSELPVLSFSESNENYTGEGSYTASLHNQCALVKFFLENPAGSIQVGGMHTEATISFAIPSITPTGTEGPVRLYSKSNTEKWAILLPQAAVSGASVTVGGQALTVDVPAITVNAYITSIPRIANSAVSYGDLSQLTADYEAQDGDILYGILAGNYKITIAPGATVTLSGATIDGTNKISYSWAGLNCLGNATIILKDGSTNNVKGFYEDYPGIHVPEGNTLTIKGETLGTGSLNASSYPVESGSGAGIGGGENLACGNIEIQGGVITATGSTGAAGIGSGNYGCGTITISGGTITSTGGASGAGIGSGFGGGCGNITISGGIVTSTGGDYSAGIGGGKTGSCGNITIESTVTNVTAVRGIAGSYSIGRGDNGSCGTVTIGGVTGAITESPYTYPVPTGAISGKFSVSSTKQVYFSQGNLQAVFASAGTTCSWKFAANQWDYIGGRSSGGSEAQTGNNFINGNGSVSAAGTVDLYGWSTDATTYGIHYSQTNSTYSGSFQDWGSNAITNGGNTANCGWYTLSDTEWEYLVNTRSGATVGSTQNARYTLATINTDGTGVNGMILFPDNGSFAASEATTWGTINATSDWTTKCTAAQWTALEAKGCVFLPAAGGRMGTNCNSQGTAASYYTSTNYGTEHAYRFAFDASSMTIIGEGKGRLDGRSVRLVRNAN